MRLRKLRNWWFGKALLLMAHWGDAGRIQLYLGLGVDVDVRDKSGRTALMISAGNGHTEAVQVLLGAGADVNATDNDGMQAWMHAEARGHSNIVIMLRQEVEEKEAKRYLQVGRNAPCPCGSGRRYKSCCGRVE